MITPRPLRPSAAIAVATLVVTLLTAAAVALEVPYLSGRVVDLGDMLPADVEARLDDRLARHEAATGNQVAVLTLGSLEDEVIEDYGIRVVETWKLGREGIDDGVLLLLARDERQMRIEVGYGLEGTLTDALSSRILNEIMRPRLRQGDVAGGVEAGVEGILRVLEGAELPAPAQPTSRRGAPSGDRWIFFIFAFWIAASISRGVLSSRGIGVVVMFFVLLLFWGGLTAIFFGPIAAVVVSILWLIFFPVFWLFLHRTAPGRALLERWRGASRRHRRVRRGGWSSGGGWFPGGGFGGGGFSGGGGFGGFSGGGGSFGGGGSSSGW